MNNRTEITNQIGRPKINIPIDELISLMTFFPTLEETASWFNCSPDTIERIVKEIFNTTFAEFRHFKSGKTRLLIKRKAISKALEESNDKMLLYCLRTMTDFDDREKAKVTTEPSEKILKLAYGLYLEQDKNSIKLDNAENDL